MKTAFGLRRASLAIALALASASVWSADPPPASAGAQAAPSKDVREKMAALHEQMATCLRSDRTVAECRTEMRTSCLKTVGTDGCPMMGLGRGADGHHDGHHRMQPAAPPASSSK